MLRETHILLFCLDMYLCAGVSIVMRTCLLHAHVARYHLADYIDRAVLIIALLMAVYSKFFGVFLARSALRILLSVWYLFYFVYHILLPLF